MTTVAYRTYQRVRRSAGQTTVVHGRYDGLATSAIAHPHAQLFIPLAGRAHVAPEGRDGAVIGPESAVYVPAGLAHAASSLDAEVEFLAVNAPRDWALMLAATHELSPPRPGLVVLRDAGVWLTARALADRLGAPPGGDAFVEAALLQLGLLLLAHRPAAASPDAGVLRAVDRVFRAFAEPLTVTGLAAEAGLGVRQFERRFQLATGSSPRRFLVQVRLAAARDLLVTSPLAVQAVAERVGFADATHLTRAFREATGQTPGAWRKAQAALAPAGDAAPPQFLSTP